MDETRRGTRRSAGRITLQQEGGGYMVEIKSHQITFNCKLKMTGETPEVRSDKRKPRQSLTVIEGIRNAQNHRNNKWTE